MTSAGNSNGSYTMTPDALGRVTIATDMWGDTLTMAYDGVGNRISVQDNFGGMLTSTYNGDNRLVTLTFGGTGQTPARVDLGYSSAGLLTGVTRYQDDAGNVVAASSAYGYTNGQLTSLRHNNGSGTNLVSYSYAYSGVLVTSETRNGTVTPYGYNALGELTSDGVHTLGLDGMGNRTSSYNGTSTATYSVSTGNQVTTDGTWNYTYDLEGNETKKVNISTGVCWTYGYDNKNERIRSVNTRGAARRRRRSVVGGCATRFGKMDGARAAG